jgi:MFS family permease
MSIEAILAAVTPRSEIGRVSGWFQAGYLGGTGLGGGLGLYLLQTLPAPWMTGAVLGMLFLACTLALTRIPDVAAHRRSAATLEAVKGVVDDLRRMVRTRPGLLSAAVCFLPFGTGAAQTVLTQSAVAARWGAGAAEIEKVQGLSSGVITAAGCFVGGWLCRRVHPRTASVAIGVALALVAFGMAFSPATIASYVAYSFAYAFGIGLGYAAFTAVVLDTMGRGSAATKYNIFASLSNFPVFWLGLLLGRVADRHGVAAMLVVEAAFGVAGVAVFAAFARALGRTTLAADVPA